MNVKIKKGICSLLVLSTVVLYGFLWLKKDVMTAKVTLITLLVIMTFYCKVSFEVIKIKEVVCNRKNWYQIGTLAFFVIMFLSTAVTSKIKAGLEIPIKIFGIVAILIGIVIAIAFLSLREKIKTGPMGRKFDIGIIVVCVIAALSRIPMFTHIQMWDGAIYYEVLQRTCDNFDFTLASIWNGFRLAGHYTYMYTFFVSMGEFLFPGQIVGVQLAMLIMTIIALICIYKMFQGYWCHMSRRQAGVMTVIISLIPNFYGLFSNINIDYFLIIFFVYLIYAEYKQWEIMRLFWMVCVVLTKETGLFIIAGYGIAHILMLWKRYEKLKIKDRIIKMLDDSLMKSIVLAIMALCCFVLIQGSLFTWMGIGQKSFMEMMENYIRAANGKNLVLFVMSFMIHKTVQLFTMSFTWIPTIAILFIWIKSRKEKKIVMLRGMEGVLGGLTMFILFSIFGTILIASTVSRYIIFSTVLLWVVAIVFCSNEYKMDISKIHHKIGMGSLIIILFLQSFTYIDPITNLWFDRLDTGNGVMISGEKDYYNYGDTFVNNNYHRYIGDLIDKMLCEINYNEEIQIVLPYERDYVLVPGDGILYTMKWDLENKRRTLNKNLDERCISINQIRLEDMEIIEPEIIKNNAVVYFMPYIECDEEAILKKLGEYYEIGDGHVISNWGGSIVYYELEYNPIVL